MTILVKADGALGNSNTQNGHTHPRYERKLGDTEASYYLPSRESGVNDMYLHLGGRAASPKLVTRERVLLVWAILRVRHPLLASKVEMHDYDNVKFVYVPPTAPQSALDNANENLEFRSQAKDELIDSYLNGPRTLSNDRLSYLIVSLDQTRVTDSEHVEFDILICATHFLGDGMALHQFANDFFSLLAGLHSLDQLSDLLANEWSVHCSKKCNSTTSALPSALEDRLPLSLSKFRSAAARVDFKKSEEKFIGGHIFPRKSGQIRHTVVPTVSYDLDQTKKLLRKCKEHGVSISSVLFALCNIAWLKDIGKDPEMPTMMYSALNLRPYLTKSSAMNDSYWFLAIGYFNVVLPGFLPRSGNIAPTFWHRAKVAKNQSAVAAKHPLTVSRTREMARERVKRARIWAKEDDEKANGTWKSSIKPTTSNGSATSQKAPSNALIGLSLLGNLDAIYKHSTFPDIRLHTLTTGSRQRPGGMLLFGYTFAGKMWLSLGYDENGFDKNIVDRFWHTSLDLVKQFLLD